jgi:hypothetical protein
MPIYEFLCEDPGCRHHKERFDMLNIAPRNTLAWFRRAPCPACGGPTIRCEVPSSPASFRMGGAK